METEIILHDIKDSEVWAIEIKNGDKRYVTLHYDTENGAGVLHTESALVGFESYNSLKQFCKEKQLSLPKDEISHSFDFDIEIGSAVYCKRVIELWNLLLVMARAIGVEAEGAGKEYERLYSRIFDHAPTGNASLALERSEQTKLERIFSHKDEILDKFIFYTE